MKTLNVKRCLNCDSTFKIRKMSYPSLQKREDSKRFCKSICARLYGSKISWKNSKENRVRAIKIAMNDPKLRQRMSEWQKGEKAPWWKGDDATYNSKHRWIQKNWKRNGRCELCKTKPLPRINGYSGTEWANVSGQYNRDDRKDWLELCSKCHKFFDKTKKMIQYRY